MSLINRQTDYAIRILLSLAKRPPGTRVSSAVLREEMLIPKALSHRIVADLAHGNFILTFPGRTGGLQLARPAAEINLLQVVRFFQGPIEVSDCLVNGEYNCPFDQTCPVHSRWSRLNALIQQELESQNLETLAIETLALETKVDHPIRPKEAPATQ